MKINNSLYFDHQATTPVSTQVFAKMAPYFRESFGNPHSSDHTFGWESSRAIDQATQQIASLIGADSDEIFFTSGATESNNLALLGLVKGSLNNNKESRILISSIEHKCILAIGRELEELFGLQVEALPVEKDGRISMSELENALDNDVLAISFMAVNNEIGTIQDIERISRLARQAGAIFHCDAAQAPIAMEMKGLAQDVDLLSLSGHKIYGPKGVGALYINRDLQDCIQPIFYGGDQQNGIRPGTIPTPLCVGMGAAAELLTGEAGETNRSRLRELRDYFAQKLSGLSWSIFINGPISEHRHPGNLNICFPGFSAMDILQTLQPHLAASTGSACTSGIPEPSHVLKAIGLSSDDAEASIRFSLGFDTTYEDVDEAVTLIDNTLNELSITPTAIDPLHKNQSEANTY